MTVRFPKFPVAAPGIFRALLGVSLTLLLCQCANHKHIYVSIADQKMALLDKNELVATYTISTGLKPPGDTPGSGGTPLGTMKIARKIGGGAPAGAVFKSRRRTGEVLPPNAPGRDPIVTRILWLKGTERRNRNAYSRYIYIHGTPEERNLGKAVSMGCIRMASSDIIDLYDRVPRGTKVTVIQDMGDLR